MTFDKYALIDAGADEIQYMVEWFSRAEALDLAERIFDTWDKSYGAFDTYEDYNQAQRDMFLDQGDLFDERQSLPV